MSDKIMTAVQFVEATKDDGKTGYETMEAYHLYRLEAERKVPKDVEDAINAKYPIKYTREETLFRTDLTYRDFQEMQQNAAIFGYSLNRENAMRFAKWISEKEKRGELALINGEYFMALIFITIEKLYELFSEQCENK